MQEQLNNKESEVSNLKQQVKTLGDDVNGRSKEKRKNKRSSQRMKKIKLNTN